MAQPKNDLRLVIEQTEDGAVLSRLTLEYPQMPNQVANHMQFALIGGLVETVKQMDELKNGPLDLVKLASEAKEGREKAADKPGVIR